MGSHEQFDIHAPELPTQWRTVFERRRQECPVARTESHGGFWVLSRYADIWEAARHDDVFSSRNDASVESPYQGVLIPPNHGRTGMIEMDREEWNANRRLVGSAFSASAVERYRQRARDVAMWAIDSVVESGHADLINDLGTAVPAVVLFELLGIPLDNWRAYADAFHAFIYTPRPSPEWDAAEAETVVLMSTIAKVVDERRVEPRDDLISWMVSHDVQGEPLTTELICEQLFSFLGAGLDTTTNLFGASMLHLSQNPDLRDHLIEHPEARAAATEEWLRYYSPLQGMARTVSKDVTISGHTLTEGERVWLLYASANHDPDKFPDPDSFIADRLPNSHFGFGVGMHKCIGQHLARMEFSEMLDAVLTRIPDFSVIEADTRRYPSIAFVNGFITMPATFTPGERVGPHDVATVVTTAGIT